jgi:hypothetical protein
MRVPRADEHAASAAAESAHVAPLLHMAPGPADDAAGLGGAAHPVADLAGAIAARLAGGNARYFGAGPAGPADSE